MRFVGLAVCALTLGGCVDNYSVAPGSAASEVNLKSDIKDCRDWASDQYLWVQGHGGGVFGIFGAVGGIAVAATASSVSDTVDQKYGPLNGHSIPAPTTDQMIESCMKTRGYIGSSKTG